MGVKLAKLVEEIYCSKPVQRKQIYDPEIEHQMFSELLLDQLVN